MLPRKWTDTVDKFGEDTLNTFGSVPQHVQTVPGRLTKAFKEENFSSILKNSAQSGHHIADLHFSLHVAKNHNG